MRADCGSPLWVPVIDQVVSSWGAHTSDLPLLTHQLPSLLAIIAPDSLFLSEKLESKEEEGWAAQMWESVRLGVTEWPGTEHVTFHSSASVPIRELQLVAHCVR